jgi:hypothetical protein
MAKKILSHTLILMINFILWTVSVQGSEMNNEFILDTQNYIQHKPIMSDAIRASQKIANINDVNLLSTAETPSGLFCTQKKRNNLYLQNDKGEQNYVSVRGGIVLNYTNCDNGDNARIKVKRNNIYGYYQIKF